jgi:hypothetical protein
MVARKRLKACNGSDRERNGQGTERPRWDTYRHWERRRVRASARVCPARFNSCCQAAGSQPCGTSCASLKSIVAGDWCNCRGQQGLKAAVTGRLPNVKGYQRSSTQRKTQFSARTRPEIIPRLAEAHRWHSTGAPSVRLWYIDLPSSGVVAKLEHTQRGRCEK